MFYVFPYLPLTITHCSSILVSSIRYQPQFSAAHQDFNNQIRCIIILWTRRCASKLCKNTNELNPPTLRFQLHQHTFMYNIEELDLKLLSELRVIAEKMDVSNYKKLQKIIKVIKRWSYMMIGAAVPGGFVLFYIIIHENTVEFLSAN